MTSHDAVFKLRKILGTQENQSWGTLDPDVVGVFAHCSWQRQPAWSIMQDEGKVYEEITLGYSTTTEDAGGEAVAETPVCLPWMKSLSMKRLRV